MTDSNCKRAGYDSTGRYRVPELDQCNECRGHGEHNPECSEAEFPPARSAIGSGPEFMSVVAIEDLVAIPLSIQEHIFKQGADYASLDLEAMLLNDWEEVKALALTRLRRGYEEYGSGMFTWDAETRRQNVLEELADSLVYLISGPVE